MFTIDFTPSIEYIQFTRTQRRFSNFLENSIQNGKYYHGSIPVRVTTCLCEYMGDDYCSIKFKETLNIYLYLRARLPIHIFR